MLLLTSRHDRAQDELAKKVNVRGETIVFLEKNKYNPSLKPAYDIAKIFDVTIEEIFIFDSSFIKGSYND